MKSRADKRRRPFWGPAFSAAAAIGLGLYAATLLAEEFAAGPLIETARAVEASRELPNLSPHGREVLERALRATTSCSALPARARLTTSFFLLQHATAEAAAPDLRLQALSRTYVAVLSSLRCNPLDGKLWAVAASLENVTRYDPERFRTVMALSVRTAPFEQGALDARWTAIASAPDLDALLDDSRLSHDLYAGMAGTSPGVAVLVIDRLLTRGFCRNLLLPLSVLDRERSASVLATARATELPQVTRLVEAIAPRDERRMAGWRAGRLPTAIRPRDHLPPCPSDSTVRSH